MKSKSPPGPLSVLSISLPKSTFLLGKTKGTTKKQHAPIKKRAFLAGLVYYYGPQQGVILPLGGIWLSQDIS